MRILTANGRGKMSEWLVFELHTRTHTHTEESSLIIPVHPARPAIAHVLNGPMLSEGGILGLGLTGSLLLMKRPMIGERLKGGADGT